MTLIILTTQHILVTNLLNYLFILSWIFLKKNKLFNKFFCGYIVICILDKTNTTIPGLQNILSTIHPVIILSLYGIFLKQYFLKNYHSLPNLLNLFSIMFIALFLGGWWAFQEFTWGGWWNWDGVETPVFIFTITFVYYYLHISNNSYFKLTFYTKFLQTTLSVFILILLTRYGILNSVHSFVQIGNTYQIYWSLMLVVWFFGMFLYICKFFSIQTLLVFKKCLYVILLTFFFNKNVVDFATKISGAYKLLQHKNYVNLLLVNIVYNITYVEFNYKMVVDHFNLYTANHIIFWKKPNTDFLADYFYHLNSLIN